MKPLNLPKREMNVKEYKKVVSLVSECSKIAPKARFNLKCCGRSAKRCQTEETDFLNFQHLPASEIDHFYSPVTCNQASVWK